MFKRRLPINKKARDRGLFLYLLFRSMVDLTLKERQIFLRPKRFASHLILNE